MKIIKSRDFDFSVIGRIPVLPVGKGRRTKAKKGVRYMDMVCAFDIETTRLEEMEQSIMYIWQFQIDSLCTVIGRTWEEYRVFIERLEAAAKADIVVYIHNASYEWQFLKTVFDFDEKDIFAMDTRKVLRFKSGKIEYRCSYLQSNMSLAKFTETDKDSRWDGTFATQYRVNMAKGGNKAPYVNGANGSQIKNGETYLKFLSADEKDANVTYAQSNGSINAGTMDGEPAFVIKLENISRQTYPGLWKTIDTRTDRNMETELGSPNAGSIRPYPIAKFSEFYFIAAEAAVKGATGEKSARDLINVIRARAGKWTFSVGENKAKVEDHSAELTEATPAEITIDYIMDERLREYFGEGYRWFDLVRTQTWEKFAGVYHIADGNGRQAVEKKRTIEKYFYLRPIPQGQLDAMTITPEEKAVYQNPGY